MGVIGMNLTDQDEIIGMQLDHQGDSLLIVSEKVWAREHIWMSLPYRNVAVKV